MKLLFIFLAGAAAALLAVELKMILSGKRKPEEKKEPAPSAEELPPDARETVSFAAEEPHTMLMAYSTLILKEEGGSGRQYEAELSRPVLIGRGTESDIRLEDDSVSRKHLRMYREDGTVWAENLSEMNGTLLNGCKISGLQEIRSGDRLTLGRLTLCVDID